MYPKGIDPKEIERLQNLAKTLPDLERYHRSAHEGLLRNEELMRQARESAERQAENFRASGSAPPTPPPGVMQSIQAAKEMLTSADFQDRLDGARQALELANSRFGPGGIEAAERVAAQYLTTNRGTVEAGYRRATEKIREGHAGEILNEAAALASSPEAREAVEQADEEALLQAPAEQQGEQGDEAPGVEIRAGLDVETVMAMNGWFTASELDALLLKAGPLIPVLQIIVAVCQFANDPKGKLLDKAEQLLADVQALHDSAKAAREAKKDS